VVDALLPYLYLRNIQICVFKIKEGIFELAFDFISTIDDSWLIHMIDLFY